MGQDWVSTGEAWERCLAGRWMRTKQDPIVSLCFLVTLLEGLSCFMEKGRPWQDRGDGLQP